LCEIIGSEEDKPKNALEQSDPSCRPKRNTVRRQVALLESSENESIESDYFTPEKTKKAPSVKSKTTPKQISKPPVLQFQRQMSGKDKEDGLKLH